MGSIMLDPDRETVVHIDAIRELVDLYDGAQEAEGTPTALDLGGFQEDRSYKIGRLVITSVSLNDDGLKGGNQETALMGSTAEYVQDPEVAAAMEGLGLPSTFVSEIATLHVGDQCIVYCMSAWRDGDCTNLHFSILEPIDL